MESESINFNAIIAIIGALLTVAIKMFDVIASWKKSRESERRTALEIDLAIKDVEFINGWLAAVGQSSDAQEREARKKIALGHLDGLMQTYQQSRSVEPPQLEKAGKKSNTWFYVISGFLGFGIIGLFIDDNDEFSLQYFQQNLDQDTLIGFGFILIIWVYFLINSRFFERFRRR